MAVKKPEFDFENFDEEQALADAVDSLGVKIAFGNGLFAGKFPSGEVVTVPLDIPRKLFDATDFDGMDPVEQITTLLGAMGLEDKADVVLEQGYIAALVFAEKFFTTIHKVMKVSLGEFGS